MPYSNSQAEKLARQIKDRFGSRIAEAVCGTAVPACFVAGLIGVEAGKDKNGQLVETATRFEPHVFTRLRDVRDGKRPSWSGVKTEHIKNATYASIQALATSYGLLQVMGWHCVNNLNCQVKDLRDPAKHIGYAVKLLLLNAKDGDFERGEYAGEFREWNTGSEQGRTYHADYVENATKVMLAYKQLEG